MFEVVFTPAAALELVEAYDWYEGEFPGLGGRFQAEIESTVERMSANPLQFPAVLRGARRALLRRFPYMLFFTKNDNELLVIFDYHLKTGHTLSVQNRPTGLAEDVTVVPCYSVRLQGLGLSARSGL